MYARLIEILRRPQVACPPDERIRRLEDRAELHDLVTRYAYYTDAGADDAMSALVTDDIVRLVGAMSVDGRDAFLASVAGGAKATAGRISTRHHIGNVLVRFGTDANSASVVALGTIVAFTVTEPFEQAEHQAAYAFECRRDDEGWRLAQVEVFTDPRQNAVIARVMSGN